MINFNLWRWQRNYGFQELYNKHGGSNQAFGLLLLFRYTMKRLTILDKVSNCSLPKREKKVVLTPQGQEGSYCRKLPWGSCTASNAHLGPVISLGFREILHNVTLQCLTPCAIKIPVGYLQWMTLFPAPDREDSATETTLTRPWMAAYATPDWAMACRLSRPSIWILTPAHSSYVACISYVIEGCFLTLKRHSLENLFFPPWDLTTVTFMQ